LQDELNGYQYKHAGYALCKFVEETKLLYGKQQMNYNMHQLLHLKESVANWGPIWVHTPHPFQTSVSKLSKIVKTCKGNPHDIVRSYNISHTTEKF
jgi:hypothetical protein